MRNIKKRFGLNIRMPFRKKRTFPSLHLKERLTRFGWVVGGSGYGFGGFQL
jgi:hypothetical protein